MTSGGARPSNQRRGPRAPGRHSVPGSSPPSPAAAAPPSRPWPTRRSTGMAAGDPGPSSMLVRESLLRRLRVRLECRRLSATTGEPPSPAPPESASGASDSRTRSTGKLRTAAASGVSKVPSHTRAPLRVESRISAANVPHGRGRTPMKPSRFSVYPARGGWWC